MTRGLIAFASLAGFVLLNCAEHSMTKVIFVAKKRPDLTDDEFITYWQQIHAPLVAKVPGVRRYVIQPVTRAALADADPVCDGVAEIWFENLAMVQDAAASAAGQIASADIAKFCAPQSGAVVVDEIAVAEGLPAEAGVTT